MIKKSRKEKMGKRVGIDIGIASVGWAVVDDDYNVLESGSNLFEAADANMNVDRRGFRQIKRLHRRRKTRIDDFQKLCTNSGFYLPKEKNNNQLELRVKGLENNLNEDKIYYVLANMLLHRGISYLEDALDENTAGKSDYQKGIAINQEELKSKFPCEIQMDRLNKYGQYRGNVTIKNKKNELVTLSNVFTTGAYSKEIEKFLNTQKKENKKITEEFVNEYIEIFNRKREYYVGPGNELSRTDYGRYTTNIDSETGKYITEENIFEKLIGKCSVYPDEMRAAGATYTAQEFNFLNDMNNLVINGRKLTKDEKEDIAEIIKTSNSVNVQKIIQKVIKEDISTIKGYRIDKNEKPIFHKFEQYNKLRKELEKIKKDISDFDTEMLDKIGNILTINTEQDAIIKAFERDKIDLREDVKECIISVRKNNPSLFNKWQSLSLRLMHELIPEMYEQPKEQMQLLTGMGVFKTNAERFKECKVIPRDEITKEIYNPVVRRSIRITVGVINALIKKYGEFEEIVIEMPRDRNSDEQVKRIKDFQKNKENELKNILKKIKTEYGIEIKDQQFRKHKQLSLKLKLWNEQEGICLYSGRTIEIDDLLMNPEKFEVDHIIPRSISFDDSRNNKVLVYGVENQEKGNTTPYYYLKNINRDWNYAKFKSNVLTLKNKKCINRKKADNLLYEEDITKIEVLKGFVSRNINDTRYASKVVLNTLQDYFRAKEENTKVKVVRGSFTHQMRKMMKLKKDREESYSHHAVDAMLIAYSQMGFEAYRKLQYDFFDFETGEILDEEKWNQSLNDETFADYLYADKWLKIKNHIDESEKKVKFWHKVDKKINRGLCNQTIRGTREYDGKTYKINKINIFTKDGYKTFCTMLEKGKEKQFLMYKNDPKTFEDIKLIYDEYKEESNAFQAYENETGDYVRKHSKKHNGPRVQILKYTDGEVGSCIDISHKYGFEKGSHKVILESLKPYRTDIYYNEKLKSYALIGLKFSDFKCENGKYLIDEDAYSRILVSEKLIKEGENRKNLKEKGYIFKFSLFKNDIIQYEKNGKYYMERFLSRTMPNVKNYIETKPIDAAKFQKRNLIGLSKTQSIRKFRVDILGNKYSCEKEKFQNCIDL